MSKSMCGRTWFVATVLSVSVLLVSVGCSDSTGQVGDAMDDGSAGYVSISWVNGEGLPGVAESGAELSMVAVVKVDGEPLAGAVVESDVLLGGGGVSPAEASTGADGTVSFQWRVGLMPVTAALRLSVRSEAAFVDHVLQVESTDPIAPLSFGGVGEALAAAGVEGSTEGLAFDDSGNLWLAVPGHLVRLRPGVDTELVEVGGDGLVAPLGMAWDYLRRCLWIADRESIRRVTLNEAEGVLTATAHVVAGLDGLKMPNSLAIRDNRHVWFSDSCTGGVYRFEPGAETVALESVAAFDLALEGGPNGLAFDDSGRLWVTTENVGLLCPDSGVDLTLNNGGLYVLDIGASPAATKTPRLEGFAMFGDGLGFDADGNLYAIFDHFDGFALKDSAVWLVPEEGDPVKVAAVAVPDGASGPDRLIANMAWGWDDFGNTTVYFSLLAVTLVSDQRGAMSADFDTRGRALIPADLPD